MHCIVFGSAVVMNRLSQSDANRLIEMEKHITDQIDFPAIYEQKKYEAFSLDDTERFYVRINRTGRFVLSRGTYQTSHYTNQALLRLDLAIDKPHCNPDGNKIEGPHIHIYKEGYDMKWAYPIADYIPEIVDYEDLIGNFMSFCKFCHIRLNGVQSTLA